MSTKPRDLGNLAREVVEAMIEDLNQQERILFDALSHLALDEDKKAVAELGRLRDRQKRLREVAVKLVGNNFRDALDLLKQDD